MWSSLDIRGVGEDGVRSSKATKDLVGELGSLGGGMEWAKG